MHPTHPRPPRLGERLGIDPQVVADLEAVTPANVLRGAACYLQLHGWHQGANYADETSPTPAACTLGALGMAAFGQRFPVDAYRRPEYRDYNRAEDFLCDYLGVSDAYVESDSENGNGVDLAGIAVWNDDPARTAEQVIQALTAAADDWDRHHPGGAR